MLSALSLEVFRPGLDIAAGGPRSLQRDGLVLRCSCNAGVLIKPWVGAPLLSPQTHPSGQQWAVAGTSLIYIMFPQAHGRDLLSGAHGHQAAVSPCRSSPDFLPLSTTVSTFYSCSCAQAQVLNVYPLNSSFPPGKDQATSGILDAQCLEPARTRILGYS